MLTVTKKAISDLTTNELSAIHAITEPYYVDPTQLLSRELEHCNEIYLTVLNDQLASYFMIGWETLLIQGKKKDALFLGLSCADKQHRGQNFTSLAYIQSAIDIVEWQQKKHELIIWGTTATPIILKVVPKFWNLIQPGLTGNYNAQYVPIADAIREKHYAHGLPYAHPFVLKGVATSTRYSEEEYDYLGKVAHKINIPIFESLGIDERNGDRLLMLVEAPNADKLEKLKQELNQIYKSSIII